MGYLVDQVLAKRTSIRREITRRRLVGSCIAFKHARPRIFRYLSHRWGTMDIISMSLVPSATLILTNASKSWSKILIRFLRSATTRQQ